MTFPKKLLSLSMAFFLAFAAAACGTQSGGGTQGGETPGGQISGGTQGGGTQGGTEQPPVQYVYGTEHADEYDGAYTERLLGLGEQAFTTSQLAGTDGLGRKKEADGGSREGRYVGIFYFLWHNGNAIYDISKLLEEYGEYDLENNPLWVLPGNPAYDANISPATGALHYFEEPFYGYYHTTDPWVLMRHMELLGQIGIDFLYLDLTNARPQSTGGVPDPSKTPNNIYHDAVCLLMDTILELQTRGIKVPKIVPMVSNPMVSSVNEELKNPGVGARRTSAVVEWIYHHWYAAENFKYKDCWFTADAGHNPSGKPLLVSAKIDQAYFKDQDAYDAFWYRNVVWPTQITGPEVYVNGFPWMDYELPQHDYDGVMNVSVAQHIDGHWSSKAFLASYRGEYGYAYRGRGAVGDQKYAYETENIERANNGLNFAEQWLNVLNAVGTDREPWMVTVTGWNEWAAGKWDEGEGVGTFVDSFSIAFSRDIEMMRDPGGYADNFYMQLATNVSLFKQKAGTKNSAAAMWEKQTLPLDNFAAWENVKAKYVDFKGDALKRDHVSVGNVYTYTDDSARNDIEYVKIANDEQYLYVLVKTAENVTPYAAGDEGWMNLYLSTGEKGGWEYYNFVINRHPDGTATSIEKLTSKAGKIAAEELEARADYAVSGNQIAYRIPLEALGVTSKSEIQLKACDNVFGNRRTEKNDGVGVYEFGDVMAFYSGGDCAPLGRLNYAYRMAY